VIVQTDAHDRLDLPTGTSTGRWSHWERVPNLQSAYNPVLKRIQKGLMLMMVLFDFLSRRITYLQQRASAA
jgi:hypothetical protein